MTRFRLGDQPVRRTRRAAVALWVVGAAVLFAVSETVGWAGVTSYIVASAWAMVGFGFWAYLDGAWFRQP